MAQKKRRSKSEKTRAQRDYEIALMLIYKYKPGRWSELEHVLQRAGLAIIRDVDIEPEDAERTTPGS